MYAYIFILLWGLCLPVTSQYATECPGGHQQGAIVRTDPYWYECVNGRLEPRGCITNTGRQIRIGESFTLNDEVEERCERVSGTLLKLRPVACIINRNRVEAGRDYQSTTTWYQCINNGHYLTPKVSGCILDGRRVNIGSKVQKDDTSYECQLTAGREAKLHPVGCLRNGRVHPIGNMFDDGLFFFHCSLNNDNTCRSKIIGCIHNSKRYFDRQVYHKGQELFRCKVDVYRDSGDHKLIGCLKTDAYNREEVEKVFGCQWEDGTSPNFYMVECVEKDGRAVKEAFRCRYNGHDGRADLRPGCMATFKTTAVGCVKSPGGQLEIRTFAADDEGTPISLGLVDDPYTCNIFARRYRRRR